MTTVRNHPFRLAARVLSSHAVPMFSVTEAEAAAIRTAFDQGGEFAAAVELRRLFPGVTDNSEARQCARTIASWRPVPVPHKGPLQPEPPLRRRKAAAGA
jgi:hypothetical protein